MDKAILVKIGEVWLKGGNRGDFIDRLVLNIQNQTGIDKKDIKLERGRIYIDKMANDKIQMSNLMQDLRRVFGIHSFVAANKVELDYDKIKEAATTLMEEKLGKEIKTFRVTSSRAFKGFEKTSEEISREIGAVLLENFPNQLKVKLKEPEIELIIEIRQEGSFLYFKEDETEGAGGLPVGMGGKALTMLSGGIDSPIALWLLMKRGMQADAVYFHSPPYTGDKTKEKIIDLCKVLSEWRGEEITLYVPYFTEIQTESSKVVPDEFWTLVHRRFMVGIADNIAKNKGYNTLASGESLGQVASQTIENMTAVAHGAKHEILRPLLGFDKQETIDLAKKIGTYKTSILPFEDCCTVFSSVHPRTRSTAEELDKWGEKLNEKELTDKAMEKIEIYKISKNKIENVNY